jgi:hypothetical protein
MIIPRPIEDTDLPRTRIDRVREMAGQAKQADRDAAVLVDDIELVELPKPMSPKGMVGTFMIASA